MSQENSYNPTSSAFIYSKKYEQWEQLKDNRLVHQFSLKSYNELTAAEHNINNKRKALDSKSKDPKVQAKIAAYDDALETLDMMSLQIISFSADLMFETEEATARLAIQDAEIVTDDKEPESTTKEVESKLDVIHKKEKEEPVVDAETNISEEVNEEATIALPAFAIPDLEVKATMHQAVKDGDSKEHIIDWLKQMVEKEMFEKGSKILNNLKKGEFEDKRYERYVAQFFVNPATGPQEKTEEPKSEVTEIPLPEEPISFNKMKDVVKNAFKDNVADKVVESYVNQMIHKKKFKQDPDKIIDKKARKDWIANVKNGVMNARKATAEADKVAATVATENGGQEPIFDEEIEKSETPKELLNACQGAENELKAGNRDKAIGIIKHYLEEYGGDAKGAFNDLDISRLLNWIDEDIFHHRNPMDLLYNIPLSIADVVKEVQRLTKIEGKSRKDIQDLIFSKVDGVKMREHKSNDDIMRDRPEFDEWFERMCGFVFRDEEFGDSLKEQELFEKNFEENIRKADSSDRKSVVKLVKEYKKGLAQFNPELDLNGCLKIIVGKLEALNPELKKEYDKPVPKDKAPTFPALPAKASKSEEDGASKEDSSGTGSADTEKVEKPSGSLPFSKAHPDVWGQTKKVKSIEGLTNFILKNEKMGPAKLFAMARELVESGQIRDAVTKVEVGEGTVPWDNQQTSNWFRLGPALILEATGLFTAKNTVEFKEAINKYITRNPAMEQTELLKKITELLVFEVAIKSKFVKKQTKNKYFNVTLQKLYEEVLEDKHVSTT